MSRVRLDRFLADAGRSTRSQVKELIRKGRAAVGGSTVKDGSVKVDPETDVITLDGQVVSSLKERWFMLHKPAGIVCAARDSRERVVMELFAPELRERIFPIGRLDKDTTGLLLFTDNGECAHRLLSPLRHVEKEYIALLSGIAEAVDEEAFAAGLEIGDDKPALPAKLERIPSYGNAPGEWIPAPGESLVRITLHEGRFHQVKRMCQAVGKPVIRLHRAAFGPVLLDPSLAPGEYRPLREDEIAALRLSAGYAPEEET